MNHKDVKYTPLRKLDVTVCAKCSSPRRIVACLVIVILTLVGLLFTCYNQSNICNSNHYSYKSTKRQLPQCIVIGARKAGTRALLTYLKLHPDIQTAPYEIHFFDNSEHYDFGYEWYKKQMPLSFPDQLTIEKSPAYFNDMSVPVKVKAMNASIKLLLIVRDPVSRCISDQLQLMYKHAELKEKTIEELFLRKDGEVDTNAKTIQRSFYDIFLANWLKHFPLKQIFIVDGDAMIQNPYEEIYKVETFLGVRHGIPKKAFVFNETRGFFCVRTEVKYRCLSGSKGRPHPDVDRRVLMKLAKVFVPHNNRFYQLTNKTFNWNNLYKGDT